MYMVLDKVSNHNGISPPVFLAAVSCKHMHKHPVSRSMQPQLLLPLWDKTSSY